MKHFLELKSMMEKNSRFLPEIQNLKEEIEVFEKKYRNKLLLTPKEWDTNISDLFSFTEISAACPIATAFNPSSSETSGMKLLFNARINAKCSK